MQRVVIFIVGDRVREECLLQAFEEGFHVVSVTPGIPNQTTDRMTFFVVLEK